MFRFLFLRVVLPLLVFWLIRGVIKSIFASFGTSVPSQRARQTPPDVPTGGELKKDPVCGTFVSVNSAVTRVVDGELVHFCSSACSDKYRGARA